MVILQLVIFVLTWTVLIICKNQVHQADHVKGLLYQNWDNPTRVDCYSASLPLIILRWMLLRRKKLLASNQKRCQSDQDRCLRRVMLLIEGTQNSK
ncbi:hypothetical protein QL285_036043 [Trifolium repens]|nr:hypothetical protein QL285_036043 [Trifolium repens]